MPKSKKVNLPNKIKKMFCHRNIKREKKEEIVILLRRSREERERENRKSSELYSQNMLLN
ncbi:MAG: hypothetical protein WC839_00245 [Candidatus Paceibacterota bacterium]